MSFHAPVAIESECVSVPYYYSFCNKMVLLTITLDLKKEDFSKLSVLHIARVIQQISVEMSHYPTNLSLKNTNHFYAMKHTFAFLLVYFYY